MEGATFLTRVVLENYKSIAHCDVRLGPLNYLVGPNGAGKSNFLDALRFVADALKQSVGHALRSRGGGAAICHAPHKREGYFRIHLQFLAQDGTPGHYTLRLGQSADSTAASPWEVQQEVFCSPAQPGEPDPWLGGQDPVRRAILGNRLALAALADEPTCSHLYAALTRMLFYNIKPRSIEDVATLEAGDSSCRRTEATSPVPSSGFGSRQGTRTSGSTNTSVSSCPV